MNAAELIEWYKNNPSYHKDYYQKNKEHFKDINRKAYHRNKDERLRKQKERKMNWSDARRLYENAKDRAREKDIEFSLRPEDIIVPKHCPILDILLEKGQRNNPASPSLDRINNTKGYTRDNIVVVSQRANMLKGDATIEELKKLYGFYSRFF